MSPQPLRLVFLGLSLSSSWGNGHATNFRGLLRALHARKHSCLFLERDTEWYAAHRDLPDPDFAELRLYSSLAQLEDHHAELRAANAVIIGSFVPDGQEVIDRAFGETSAPVLFYDIDTPVTLAALQNGGCGYLRRDQISRFAAYLSFTAGPALAELERQYGARRAIAFHCLVDPVRYAPRAKQDNPALLGYLGTYSEDRQPALTQLLLQPARRLPSARFVVAGPQYPHDIDWPANVRRLLHVPPDEHADFFGAQRFTLNITRQAMIERGYSPSVRLFEAAACGVPIISDRWQGIEEFLTPGCEILLADSAEDVIDYLTRLSDTERRRVGDAARQRVLREHTAEHRAIQLEEILSSLTQPGARPLAGAAT